MFLGCCRRAAVHALRRSFASRPPPRPAHLPPLLSRSPRSILSHLPAFRARFSSATAAPIPPSPGVGRWLLLSSTLAFSVIVVGAVTRLTESGLSITEWRPITGVIPPLSHADWLEEFEKYKATPEFKMYVPSHLVSLLRVLIRLVSITPSLSPTSNPFTSGSGLIASLAVPSVLHSSSLSLILPTNVPSTENSHGI